MTTPRGRRRRGEATRDALIAAALTVLERDGSATSRKIAEEAKVPLGTVHYWFASTDQLFSAVVDSLLSQIRGEVDDASEITDPAKRLRRAYDGFMAMPQGRQLALFEITLRAIRDPELRHLARDQYRAYREAAALALRPWVADTAADNGRALVTLVVAITDGLTLASLADPEGTDAQGAIEIFARMMTRTATSSGNGTGDPSKV